MITFCLGLDICRHILSHYQRSRTVRYMLLIISEVNILAEARKEPLSLLSPSVTTIHWKTRGLNLPYLRGLFISRLMASTAALTTSVFSMELL